MSSPLMESDAVIPNILYQDHPSTAEVPLNIAIVHAADTGGGAERSVMTLHRTLRRLGHRSRLFVACKQTDEPEVHQIEHVRTLPGVLRLTRWVENGIGLQNLLAPSFRNLHHQIGSADVLHIHSLWGGTFGFSDLTGVERLAHHYPTVMTLRDGFMLTGHCACPIQCDRWKSGCGRCPDLKRAPSVRHDVTALNWWRKKRTIQCSPLHITTVSQWLKTQVRESPIFAGKSVTVVHNGIDETVFQVGSQQQARAKLGLPNDAFLVLLAGQSIEGIHQGIAQHGVVALNQLNNPGITPFLVGHSAMTVGMKLNGPFVHRPFQATSEEMALCYRAADVTLVCSEYETFGRVAAESVCCGTPVIAFATGGLTDIVEHDVTGWLVPTGDVDGLARELESAFLRRWILHEMRGRICASATRKFSTDGTARRYLGVYQQAMLVNRQRHTS